MRILLEAEDGAQDPTGGIIDSGEEDQPRTAVDEPGVVAAVELDEQTGLGHPLAPTPMAGGSSGPGAANPGLPEQPADGDARQAQPFAFGQQFREVMIIAAGVGGPGESDHLGANRLREAPGRGSSPMPMGQHCQAVVPQAGEQAAQVAKGQAQQHRCFASADGPILDAGQDMHAMLLLFGQDYRLPGHAPRVTFSLIC